MKSARTEDTTRHLQNEHSVVAEVEKNYRGFRTQNLGRMMIFTMERTVVATWDRISGLLVLRELC